MGESTRNRTAESLLSVLQLCGQPFAFRMGCGQSAPALLVPQPRGAAAPILPTTDVTYSDGVTELTVGYTDAAWWKNQEIRVRKQKELDESAACRSAAGQLEELVLEFKPQR